MRTLLFSVLLATAGLSGCQTSPITLEDDLFGWMDEQGLDIPIDREYGKPLLQVVPDDTRSQGVDAYGPVSTLPANTEVWPVTRRWYQKTSEAGVAWSADSGLTWDEKYAAWVDGMEKTTSDEGMVTVQLTTPWGKKIASPDLECAEMGMFLRATFAAWYELPFFLSAYHSDYGQIHYGHFGIVTHDGQRLSGSPTFKTSYKDYTGDYANANNQFIIDNWPEDSSLHGRALTTMQDDRVEFLGDDAYAGDYFDQVHLNKRVGHFLLRLLTNFGSMHLASAKNTFNSTPESLRPGDLLIERWQRNGIGHVMVVKEVAHLAGGNMDAEIIFGSMPRIQPRWYSPTISKSYFTDQSTGGTEMSGDGVPYSQLGGGLKRWRTPVVKGGRWVNIVPAVDREDNYIGSTEYTKLGARVETFKTLLGQLSPEEELDVIIERIDMQRENLSSKPASCASRKRREEAFDELYVLASEHFGMDKAAVDAQYRDEVDYIFAELEYDEAKTCCWNSTTEDMYEIVVDYNAKVRAEAESAGECAEPVVFKARNGGYDVFRDYAVSQGKGDKWVAWSADETCPQANTPNDQEADHAWTAFCDLDSSGGGTSTSTSTGTGGEDGCGELTYEGECQGNTVVWCDQGEVYEYSCAGQGTCGWDDYYSYYWCGE